MSTKSVVRLAALMAQLSILLSGAYASDKKLGELTIRVIDQIGVPETEWDLAEQFASKVFRTAEVSAMWLHCTGNGGAGSKCPAPGSPNDINLIVVSEEAAVRMKVPPGVFGIAAIPADSPSGSRGYVFFGRIQAKCSEHHDVNAALLLGAIMAHEIGHLLLGPNSHSPKGIMKPDLDHDDIRGTTLSTLKFDKRQSETLRNQVARRLEAAHSKESDASSDVAQAARPSVNNSDQPASEPDGSMQLAFGGLN